MKIIKTYKININLNKFNEFNKDFKKAGLKPAYCVAACPTPYNFAEDEWTNRMYYGDFIVSEVNKKHILLYKYSEHLAKLLGSLEKLNVFS